MMISQESKMTAGQVSKRADDVHGLGWGNVTTGFVNRKKLGFLQRAADSMERDWSSEASPAPSATGRRVTWADSSPGSRPDSRLQDIDTMRAQTPPLAGEWAVAKSAERSVSSQQSFSQQQMGGVQFSGQSSSAQASAFSSTQQMSSNKQISSTHQMSSSSSSTQKTSFSQSTSSSFQSSSIEASKAFEAFPGMNGIENLRLEQ